jgi:hypothetical protein
MALVNSFEIINLLSKNELGCINGGKFDILESILIDKVNKDSDYDFSEKLDLLESTSIA